MKNNLPLILVAVASALTFTACDSSDSESAELLMQQIELQNRQIEEQQQLIESYAQLNSEYQALLAELEEQKQLQKQLTDNLEAEKRVNAQLSDKLNEQQSIAAQQTQKQLQTTTTTASDKYIGVEKAKSIALDHAGVSADKARALRVEFDIDDRVPSYEVEFKSGGYEYDYDIDASSGKILKSQKELDD